jgi:hypothetical protein
VRRFLRLGLVKPARWSMLPNVLVAGQSAPGSNLALSFCAPQYGYLPLKARIGFSVLSGVAWELSFPLNYYNGSTDSKDVSRFLDPYNCDVLNTIIP